MTSYSQKTKLEFLRKKLIKHKLAKLERYLQLAYAQGNYNEVEKITNEIINLHNDEIDRTNDKLDNKLSEVELELDQAFDSIENLDYNLGIKASPSEHKLIKEALTSHDENDEEVERMLEEIMKNGYKGK